MIDYQKAVKDLRDKLIITQVEFAKKAWCFLLLQSIDGKTVLIDQLQQLVSK